ncbi:hypothetical protein AA313_de0209872 [Arthrobotrys entomopaga]|nr:hypothetical protein AA313_de0209872 [Arthrobotrys entomopaga]
MDAQTLAKNMQGLDTLHKWDVLVAYDHESVNKLLKQRFEELKNDIEKIDPFVVEFDGENDDGEKVKKKKRYELALAAPTIEFLSAKAAVAVSFSISGTHQMVTNPDKPGKVLPFPSDAYLRCQTSLVNVTGTIVDIDAQKIESKDKKVTPADKMVFLETGSGPQVNHVVLDFRDASPTVIDKSGNEIEAGIPTVVQLKNHLRKSSLEYHLAAITSQSKTSDYVLKPKSFHMTAVHGDKSALLMWIKVEGTSSVPDTDTDMSPLLFSLEKEVGKVKGVSPIPIDNGVSATIVFSHETIWETFVKKALSADGFTDLSITSQLTTAGMKFQGKLPSNTVSVPEYDRPHGKGWGAVEGPNDKGGHVNSCSFSLNSDFCKFEFQNSSTDLSFEHTEYGIDYYAWDEKWVGGFNSGNLKWVKEWGKLDVKFKFNAQGSWTVNDNKIALKFAVPKTFSADPKPQDPSFWKRFWNTQNSLYTSVFNSIAPPVPDINISFKDLDYFLTTNVLFPGKNVFKVRDSSEKLFVPRDLVILGQIAQNL